MHSLDVPAVMTTAVRWEAGRAAVVEVSGDLDDHATPRLRALLDEVSRHRPARISVDLDAVTFFCSAAAAELVASRSRFPCDVSVVRPPAPARRVMAILGLGPDLQAVDG
ncbi:STAS domain-containing protein [Actinoplanes sp. NPDC049548]|uniref:STAS domain-containing protein n=1 Tax=Actinoplanes sp. NPDC049548 TaxID=3155152 RepID=UPI00342D5C3A